MAVGCFILHREPKPAVAAACQTGKFRNQFYNGQHLSRTPRIEYIMTLRQVRRLSHV